jgi:hypothetical protein
MDAGEKSDWAIVPEKRPNKGRQLPAEDVEGRARPKGNNRRPAAVRTQSRVSCVVPIGGCAPGDEAGSPAYCPTIDLREEPGALVAHAGICAGGGA